MPRYEPEVNHFIAQDDPYAAPVVSANKPRRSSTDSLLPPLQTKPSINRGRSNSVSALERLVAFAEATQRVKRRLRNFIGGAVGASTSSGPTKSKRKSRDAMNVDSEWNGWFNTSGYYYHEQPGVYMGDEQEYYATPRYAFEEERPKFPPAINRYSVTMEERSISDVSMFDDTAPTPRATTPEPSTPKASKQTRFVEESSSKKTVKVEDDDDDGDEDGEEGEENEEGEEECGKQVKTPMLSSRQDQQEKILESPSKMERGNALALSPMDEDPPTPKAKSPNLPVATEMPLSKSKQAPNTSESREKLEKETSTLNSRSSSSESSPPKTPKLSLRTNFERSPILAPSRLLSTGRFVNVSPDELTYNHDSVINAFRGMDLMEVVVPSAVVRDNGRYTFERELREAKEIEATQMRVNDLPTLLPAATITEMVNHKPKSRRGSVNSDITIARSPRRAAIIAGKKNSSAINLGVTEQIHESASSAALRAKIDALPLENHDEERTETIWPNY